MPHVPSCEASIFVLIIYGTLLNALPLWPLVISYITPLNRSMAIDFFTNQANIKQVIQRIRTSTTNAWAIFGFTDIEYNEPLRPRQVVCLKVIEEGLNMDFQHALHPNKLLYMYINTESYREGGVRKRSLVYWIGEDVETEVVNSYAHCIPTLEGLIRAREVIFIARANQDIFRTLSDHALLGDSSALGRARSVSGNLSSFEPNIDRART